jgi:hypothetical protein
MAAPQAIATNLPGAVTYEAPPAGFDPLRATDSELDIYGFPPRPTLNLVARRRWEQFFGNARVRLSPVLQQTHLAAGPPRHATRVAGGAATSQNWSGEVIETSASGFGYGAFTTAAASFNVPVASQAFGTCSTTPVQLFSWVGIDGWNSKDVFQAGTEADAGCIGGYYGTYYSAWYEWYPNYAVRITNLPVEAGDVMDVFMFADTATTGRAYIINATTNNYVVIGFSAPSGTTLSGNSVEWIQERPSSNNVLTTLMNYVGAWMSGTSAGQYGGGLTYTFGSPPAGASVFGVTMLDDSKAPISYAVPLGGNALVFADEGSVK